MLVSGEDLKKKKSSGGKEASSERFPVHNFSRPLFIQESVLYRVCFGSLQPTKLRIQIQNPCRAQNQVVRPSFMKEERHIKNSNSKSSHGTRDIPQWYGAHPAFGRPWIPSPVLRTTKKKKNCPAMHSGNTVVIMPAYNCNPSSQEPEAGGFL